MATKTLTIKEEAYERLKSLKREDESFSDVVIRVTKGDKDPMDHLGSMPGLAEEIDTDEFREKLDEDIEDRQREIFGQ